MREAIKEAFVSIDTYLSGNIQDRLLLDTHLLNQFADEEEAAELKDYILTIPRKKKETVFGVFIGYSIDYRGEADTNDEYDQKVIAENIAQVLAQEQAIIDFINRYGVSNYEFNFYFLPFHNAMQDRKNIMRQLTEGQRYFTREV